MKLLLRVFLTVILALPIATSPVQQVAHGQQRYCDLALVLAMDASSSVNSREYELQLKGMASALLDFKVQEAIVSLGGMYMAGFEWNGRTNQKLLFNWTWLETQADIFAVAQTLATHQRNSDKSPTALGAALGYAHRMFPKLPQPCQRQVIDVSGDGINNDGLQPASIYKLWDFANITVNGLAIKGSDPLHDNIHPDVEDYYRQEILRGAGAFLVIAENFESFEEAMTQKLLKEIVPGPIGSLSQ